VFYDDVDVCVCARRSLWNYKQNQEWDSAYRDQRRALLTDIIISILRKHTTSVTNTDAPSTAPQQQQLYYYQGYHDVISVIIQIIDADSLSFAITDTISTRYLRDCMLPDFKVMAKSLSLLKYLLSVCDEDVHSKCVRNYVEPFFALSWIITWFSHDMDDLEDVARCYDVLLASPPCYALYLSVAVSYTLTHCCTVRNAFTARILIRVLKSILWYACVGFYKRVACYCSVGAFIAYVWRMPTGVGVRHVLIYMSIGVVDSFFTIFVSGLLM
jgi:hypothetical protein